jgi:hypothetical protein
MAHLDGMAPHFDAMAPSLAKFVPIMDRVIDHLPSIIPRLGDTLVNADAVLAYLGWTTKTPLVNALEVHGTGSTVVKMGRMLGRGESKRLSQQALKIAEDLERLKKIEERIVYVRQREGGEREGGEVGEPGCSSLAAARRAHASRRTRASRCARACVLPPPRPAPRPRRSFSSSALFCAPPSPPPLLPRSRSRRYEGWIKKRSTSAMINSVVGKGWKKKWVVIDTCGCMSVYKSADKNSKGLRFRMYLGGCKVVEQQAGKAFKIKSSEPRGVRTHSFRCKTLEEYCTWVMHFRAWEGTKEDGEVSRRMSVVDEGAEGEGEGEGGGAGSEGEEEDDDWGGPIVEEEGEEEW